MNRVKYWRKIFMFEKKIITNENKNKIIDLFARGYGRTYVAKKIKMKNKTLEKICREENIPLPKKGKHNEMTTNISGTFLFKTKKIYFKNANELWLIFRYNNDESTLDIENFQDLFKITVKDDKEIPKILIINPENQNITYEMISFCIEKKIIKFDKDYLNKKWKINYEI